MRNLITASILVVSTLALTACTPKLSKATLESTISSTFEKQGIKMKSVTCAGDREVKAGDKFDCQGELADGGDKATIKVEQKDAKGSLSFDIVGAAVTEALVSTSITKSHGSKVDAKCPKKVAILLKGQTEVCEITAGADKGKVTVTGLDGDRVNFQAEMAGKPEAAVQADEEKPVEAEAAH